MSIIFKGSIFLKTSIFNSFNFLNTKKITLDFPGYGGGGFFIEGEGEEDKLFVELE